MAMYNKFITFLVLTFMVSISFAQQYTPMTAAGYQYKRAKVDSTLHIPSFCGVPTLRNSTAIQGALAMDTCANKLYQWTHAAGWSIISGAGGGGGTLQSVTDSGNTTTNDIELLNHARVILGDSGEILLNNGSKLRMGAIDAQTGGSKGIAQICAVGYELKWEGGSLYVMNDQGLTVREVRYKFSSIPTANDDGSKGFYPGSRWVLDNGTLYTCSDSTSGAAVWQNTTYPSLQDVATVGNIYDNGYAIVELNKEIAGTIGNYPFYFIGNEDIINRTSYIGFENDDVKLKVEQTGQFGKGININSKSFNLYNNDLSSLIDLDTSGLKIVKTNNAQSAKLAFHTRTPFATDYIAYMPVGSNYRTDTLATLDNVRYSVIDTSNKWVNNIYRTSGVDSIYYTIGSTTYVIKDSVGTNPAPVGYYGAFQDNTTQTAVSANTAYAVKLNTTDLTNGVSVVNDGSSNPTRITLANTGIYNIQFSLQLEKTGGSGNMIADIWIRKNGVDIPSTTGKVVLTGSANASPVVAAWNYVLDLAAGDYVQLMWATSNTNVEIVAAAATSPHPAIPSAILTVTQQSGIMAGTGITAINSLTGSAQTMVTGTDSTDFKIVSTGTTHKFNLPTASATNRGALSSANWSTFNSKLGSSDTVSLSSRINLKLNIADTSTMLSKYLRKTDTASLSSRIDLRVKYTDTATMLTPYLRKVDTTNRFVNNISRTLGKDSIIFNIGSTRYAIKDSVGSGTSYTFSTGLTNSSGTVTSNLSTGVAGGQSVVGGTAASNSLTLSSTSNATKGNLLFGTSAYFENTNRLGINTSTDAGFALDVNGTARVQGAITTAGLTSSSNVSVTGNIASSSIIILGNSAAGGVSYRTTNAGGGITPLLISNNNTSSSGIVGIAIDGNNQLSFIAGNGTNRISRASIAIANLNNTAGSESGDLTFLTQSGGTAMSEKMRITGAGGLTINATNTASGTTGNQTINKASGTVNIAAAGTTVTVTNSLVSATSIVFAVIRTNDATATIKNVVPAAGSFVINLGAATTAETSIGFFVIN